MSDDQDLQDTEGPPTPEQEEHERKIKKALDWLRELEEGGWQPRGSEPGTELYDPHDPEASVFFNPYTGEILLSPKYVERVNALLPASQK